MHRGSPRRPVPARRDEAPDARRHLSPRFDATAHGPGGRRLRAGNRHALPRRPARAGPPDGGFSTAELLGNAALGIAALVAIWVVLEALGVSVVAWIGAQIGVG